MGFKLTKQSTMNRYHKSVLFIMIACTSISACHNGGSAEEKAATADMALVAADSTATPAFNGNYDNIANQDDQESPKQAQAGTPTPAPVVEWDKKIIKTAILTMEVKKHDDFSARLRNMVKQTGGYIAEEQQNKSDYKIEDVVTIKVPVDQFDNLVNAITDTKENLVDKRITSQDVTGEVLDTRSRIEAKKQVRERYMELLKQAKNMDAILKVQKEINDIQVEIESGAGRVNYLNHSAAYSSVQLTFYEVLNATANEVKEPGFADRILSALKNGASWLGDMLVLLLTLWPLWSAAIVGVWIFRRYQKAQPAKAK